MAIKDKTAETPDSKGFDPSRPQADAAVDAGQLVQLVQNNAARQAVSLVQGADAMFTQIEEAAAEAVVARGSQVGVRIMDKVAAHLTQQASTDTLPTDASILQGQLAQALTEVTRSANWRQCTPDQMARRNDLFLSPAAMMGATKQLPGQ